MAKKIFKYRGKTLEELQSLSITQLANLFTSRVRRTIKRGFSASQKKFLKKVETKNNVKTHFRNIPIIPSMVGKVIKVYNGKTFVEINIIPEMIGHYLGEYSLTRKRTGHNVPGVGKKTKK